MRFCDIIFKKDDLKFEHPDVSKFFRGPLNFEIPIFTCI